MTCFGEFKIADSDEPFDDNQKHPFEKDTLSAHETRGQLIFYATEIQGSQHRTHVFSFFINQTSCRLIYWSRSGAVVTNAFNYTREDWLLQFFWRISHATDDIRGIDTSFSFVPPSAIIAQAAREALQLECSEPLYKVSVDDSQSGQTTHYVVGKPFIDRGVYPTGRATRCFEAYCCQTKQVVFLKDVWRVEGYDPEGSTYLKLHQAGVRNIANLLAAGDVPGPTHRFVDISDHALWGKIKLRPQQHRLVLDVIGKPVKEFESTWEMVNAVYHAFIDAVEKANILRRDISPGNILITRTKEDKPAGILIDWELSKDGDVKGPRSDNLTGTWQFISARLLMKKAFEHLSGDDLESFVYVIGWLAARELGIWGVCKS
ncbi:hypothetical protein L218DRAFT_1047548 [Marasmius fiardii PR-910]|nr:hypothetical protein L218DRAFT_1047548 [Marasmius fiardii PR-910]